MAPVPALHIEREEKDGDVWVTLLAKLANHPDKPHLALSEITAGGWRYGLQTSPSADAYVHSSNGISINAWDLVVDLSNISIINSGDIACTFYCSSFLTAVTMRYNSYGDFISQSKSICATGNSGQTCRGGMTKRIGTFKCTAWDTYIVVRTCIVGKYTIMKGPSALLEKKALRDAMPVVSVDPKTTQALARSLSSGTFIDMQFNTFTRMRKVGNRQRLCRTLPLYAASSALKGVEASGVGELKDIAGTNWSSLLSTSDHGRSFVDVDDEYEEDSDFDPDEEHIIEEVVEKVDGTSVSSTRYLSCYDAIPIPIPSCFRYE